MKAIRVSEFGGPEVLKLEEVPDPQPEAGQVVIRVYAAGVNPVETYIRSGSNPALPRPYTPGSDAAGEVETVGEGVSGWKPGDRVYTSATLTGAYAEKTLADAAQIYRLPENLSFTGGAAINIPYATAYRALIQRAQGRPGETVLVHGASGGVGVASVQLARSLGFIVTGTAGTEEGRELALREGAHQVFNHHEEGYLERARAATPGGTGFDIILEMLANVNLSQDLGALRPGGRVVVIGSRGTVEINPRDTMRLDTAILGMLLFNASPEDLQEIHAALYAGFASGVLRPIIGQEFPLAEAAAAQSAVMESTGHQGKIVLKMA